MQKNPDAVSSKQQNDDLIKMFSALGSDKLKRLREYQPQANDSDFDIPKVKIQYTEPKPARQTTPVLAKISKKSAITEDILKQIDQRIIKKTTKTEQINLLQITGQTVPVRIVSYRYYVDKVIAPTDSNIKKPLKLKPTKRNLKKYFTIGFAISTIGIMLGVAGMMHLAPLRVNQADAAVLGASDNQIPDNQDKEYTDWITAKNNAEFSPREFDLDDDGLTNYEEFILDTNPKLANTCSPDKTDSENLINLIDPKTCKSINTDNDLEFKKFNEVINIGKIKDRLLASTQSEPVQPVKVVDEKDLLSVFDVSSFSDLDKMSVSSIEQEAQNKDTKVKYLKQIDKIDQYIKKYRSYQVFDRDYDMPVHAAKFLDVSLKYNIPVKYLLAIARAESRFGTDRYTDEGRLTRPGEHHNMYSLGLTDSGSNVTYESWDDGVDAMGKWWKKFDDKGISIQRRLKIFNPNGDYPTKIMDMANQIEDFLNS